MRYAEHFATLRTPQSQPADSTQVKNNAGGYTFAVEKWQRLRRWLILGAEGGTYYVTEQALTVENAQTVLECLNEDGARTVAEIVEVSVKGRAPKNDPAIFALAIACGHQDAATRKAALEAIPRVCRIGTHLFQFAAAVRNFRGWGRGLRKAIERWYGEKTPEQLAYQLVKYQQRNGWSHRDLMRLGHPAPKHDALYRYVVAGPGNPGTRVVKRGQKQACYPSVSELPPFVAAFEELKCAETEARVCQLIDDHGFTHEMVDGKWKNSPTVWESLLQKMPMTAMIRNLGKMSQVGLIKPMSRASTMVQSRLSDGDLLRKARVHPIGVLSALMTYRAGHGARGSLTWNPVAQVVDALDEAFYASFGNVEPTGKRVLLALDVSSSMDCGYIAGVPNLTPRVASAAMAMVTARVETTWACVGFTSAGSSFYRTGNNALIPLSISPRQRLDDIVKSVSRLPFGGTDCALPMLYAAGNNLDVDLFCIYTDNETWAGHIHPHQALKAYRAKSGINAKLAVIGMTSNGFTIADPNDVGELDVVGFDTATPNLLAEFARM